MTGSAPNPGEGSLSLFFLVTSPLTARHLARGQLAYLERHGFDVTLVAAPGQALEEVGRHEGVRTIGVPMRREIHLLRDLGSLLRLCRLLRSARPDLVSAGTPKAGLLGMLAARLSGVPVRIYLLRGLRLETAGGWRRRLLRLTERLAAGCATRVVCVGPSLRHLYVGAGLAPAHKVVLLGRGSSNGVDLDRFRPAAPDEAAQLRRELGLPAAAPVIGFVGRFTRDKGIADLALAFDAVRVRSPDARLLLVGHFESGDPLPAGIRERLGGGRGIVVHPFAADSAPLYRAMDLLALPSYREGLPNAPLEAAACELPVAAYAATGTVDAVEDGVTGTLVPVGDWQALAAALGRYLEDPELRRRHGEAGRRRMSREFDRRLVWEAWAAEYRRSAEGPPPGPEPG